MTNSTQERYNGWANYPTWNVTLWLDNDYGLYTQAREMVERAREDAPTDTNTVDGIWTVEDTAKFRLADNLKEWVGEMSPVLEEASFQADIFGWALEQVAWDEIAANYLSED
jgi:hypothetical protein